MKPSLSAALCEVFTFASSEERPSQSPARAHHHGTNQRAAKMDLANPSHGQCPPYVSKLAKELKLAMPSSKEWRAVKQRIIRFIT